MKLDQDTLKAAIESSLRTKNHDSAIAADVAFHMTDWLGDLERFSEFCHAHEDYDPDAVEELLMDFLLHVPNHVAAAAKLLADAPVRDIFGVGAVALGDQDQSTK